MRPSSKIRNAMVLAFVASTVALLVWTRAAEIEPVRAFPSGRLADASPTAAARTVTPSPTVYGALTLTAELSPSATRVTTATPSPTAWPTIEPGTCMGFGEKVASEHAILGDTIGITLTLRALCAGMRFPLHAVLVMDGSEAMAGSPHHMMRDGALELIRAIGLDDYPSVRLAVVEFGDSARLLCPLTNDQARLRSCVRRVGARGGTSIEAGLDEARRVIIQGRRDLHRLESATELVVVFSQECDAACCQRALTAAWSTKGAGILVTAVCVGHYCDERCLMQIASSRRYLFRADDLQPLSETFQQILGHDYFINVRRVTVTDRLPPNMRYVPGSARPEPTLMSTGAEVLVWEDVYIPKEGVTYTFEVEPLETGAHATNVDARAELLSNTGWPSLLVYAVPTVSVSRRPTPTASPEATATATSIPTDPPTPTRRGAALWLPMASPGDAR